METRTQKDESVRRQLLALAGMSRPQLCDKWRDLYGSEPPNSSREFLRRRLTYRVQEIVYGGLDPALKAVLTPDTANGGRLPHSATERRSSASGMGGNTRSRCAAKNMSFRGNSTVRSPELPERSPARTGTAMNSSGSKKGEP